MKRRDFLKYSATGLASLPLIGSLPSDVFAAPGNWDRTLVLLELKGGNDGLNTIIPYSDPLYYDFRPDLAIKRDQVIQIDEKLGFNAALKSLMPLWRSKEMAVVLGVGYPDPNFSHFRSIDIWDTASNAEEFADEGWISNVFREARPPSDLVAEGVILGRNRVGPLMGGKMRAVFLPNDPGKFIKKAKRVNSGNTATANSALAHIMKQRQDLKSAVNQMLSKRIESVEAGGDFPDTKLGKQFENAARLLIAGVKTPLFKMSIGGFDTHVSQGQKHAELLRDVADSVSAFAQVMKAKGLWNKVLVMSYAEFGRRPGENNSLGTDHGTSAPHFMAGGGVKGGLYGDQPPLDDLAGKNLRHHIHFRSLYASVAQEFWGLNASFIKEKPLGIIA